MARQLHNKEFEVRGLIQDVKAMRMIPCEYQVTVSNDSHCTVSVAPEGSYIQYCLDFTKVLKALEGK